MKVIEVKANGTNGALILKTSKQAGKQYVGIGLNTKEEVLQLQKELNGFIEKNYK